MQVLASAESLTDEVASQIYGLCPIPGIEAEAFLHALHQSDLIEPRNSEWSLPQTTRNALRQLGEVDVDTLRKVHSTLLNIGLSGEDRSAGSTIPSYLFTSAGRAYHSAYSGDQDSALGYYREAAVADYSGAQWLASQFAVEQSAAGVISADETETLYLRAIVLYRQGRRQEAEPLLWKIIEKDEVNEPTSRAYNIMGGRIVKRDREKAEELLRRGLEISEEIHDEQGVAVNKHILANTIAYDRRRVEEPERLYKEAIEFFELQQNPNAVGKIRHSYGDFLAHVEGRLDDAEEVLRLAVRNLAESNDITGVGQTLSSLARVLSRLHGYSVEAEDLMRKSIAIAKRDQDDFGLARRLYGLGRILSDDPSRLNDAVAAYRESLEINTRLGRGHSEGSQLIRRLISVLERRI
jgi:tetratricopeptide (TPR) repeat protein